ncbi:MAG: ABC transporter transmembrane domain-containing protein, partial [Bacteroidota bacterium]
MTDKVKIDIGINRPFVLNDPTSFWMVVDGEIDLFYVDIDEERNYSSSLTYLYSAKKGEILFSLLHESLKAGIQLVVVGAKARLLQLDKNNLMDIDHTFLKFHINKWILKISRTLYQGKVPRIYRPLDAQKEWEIKAGEIAFPSKELVWCKIMEGEVSIFAEACSKMDKAEYVLPFPVTRNLWLKSTSKSAKIEVLSAYEVLKDELFFMLALKEVQHLFYQKMLDNEERKRIGIGQRLQEKERAEEIQIQSTLKNLRDIIKKGVSKHSLRSIASNNDNALLQVCQFIGDEVGFQFKAPKHFESYKDSLHNQLFAIGQASNVRVRKVILRGTWWKEENGHLMAFSKKDKTPIALIQKSATAYVVRDPLNGDTPVNQEMEDSLEPIAFMFFFAFDDKMDSAKKILDFALQGVKRDGKFLLLAALAGSLLGLLVPILSGIMFDDVIPTADRGMLWEVFGLMLAIGLITALLQLIQGVLQLRVETKSNLNLQGGLMDHLMRLPVSFYKRFTAGDLTNRALSINTIRQIISNTLITAVLSGTFSIVNLVLLFYYESKLAWIGVGLSLFAILFVSVIGWLKLRYDREITDDQGDIQGFLFEFLSGITKIRV